MHTRAWTRTWKRLSSAKLAFSSNRKDTDLGSEAPTYFEIMISYSGLIKLLLAILKDACLSSEGRLYEDLYDRVVGVCVGWRTTAGPANDARCVCEAGFSREARFRWRRSQEAAHWDQLPRRNQSPHHHQQHRHNASPGDHGWEAWKKEAQQRSRMVWRNWKKTISGSGICRFKTSWCALKP